MKTMVASLVLLMLAATAPADPPADRPVEQTKKNIKVLQGTPSSQLIPVMAFMSNSLGVTCAHCHTKDWESDELPAKEAARRMIVMQRAINAQQFAGKLTVTCNTCHNGHAKPQAVPEVANAGWNARPAVAAPAAIRPEEALPQLPQTPASVSRRVIRGTVERYNGRDLPKSAPFTVTIEKDSVKYDTELSHPPEASRVLGLYLIKPLRREQVRGERWTVTPSHISRERETETPLGILPDRYDYDDFRDTPSGRLPFRATWSRADYRVTFTVQEVE